MKFVTCSLVAFLSVASAQFPPCPPAPTWTTNESMATKMTVDVGGVTRSWLEYVPSNVLDPSPLVLDLHGYGLCNTLQASISGWKDQADAEGFTVVWPVGEQGLNPNTGIAAPSWNGGSCCQQGSVPYDDVAFLRAVIAHYNSPRQTYVVGHSNGGFMAYAMAMNASDVVAAVGAYGAMPRQAAPQLYTDGRKVASVQLNGVLDPFVPYNGGASDAGIVTAMSNEVKMWAGENGCDAAPVDTDMGVYNTSTYSNCEDGATTALWSFIGVGHFPYLNSPFPPASTIRTAPLVWDFLKIHTLPAPSTDPSDCACDIAPLSAQLALLANDLQCSSLSDCAGLGYCSSNIGKCRALKKAGEYCNVVQMCAAMLACEAGTCM